MRAAKKQVVIKKIRAYPFAGTLDHAGAKKPIEVTFVNFVGMVAQVGPLMLRAGEYSQVEFELPVVKKIVTAKVRIMKTYDQAVSVRTKAHVVRVAEMRFEGLGDEAKAAINHFFATFGTRTKR